MYIGINNHMECTQWEQRGYPIIMSYQKLNYRHNTDINLEKKYESTEEFEEHIF